ncbi:MAG TPA: YsnF/AvaK domain-containing protein [Flavisolibacter sp.]|nr:YsnF/AvaK domain-containing protein [Flavisolibacter sp.]
MEENRQYTPQDRGDHNMNARTEDGHLIIPVIQEQIVIDKQVIETGKVRVRKTVSEETASLNIPLIQENYDVQRVPAQQILDKAPGIRYEGDTIVVPVMREVVIVEKKYELIEEVRLTKRTTSVPHVQDITLLKEHVQVERVRLDDQGRRNP